MTDHATANNLSAFAAVADLQGHSRESVALLMDASRKLKAGERDAALSGELSMWSLVASSKGQTGFAGVLEAAASELRPSFVAA